MSNPRYTPQELRDLAAAEPSPFRPFLLNEYRNALRWSANVIEAADAVIAERKVMAIAQPVEPADAQGRAALTLLREIRYHPRRHDLDRDWLTRADKVLGTWGAVDTSCVVQPAFAPTAQSVEPALADIEQYQMQMAGISTAAFGYWKEGDDLHPDYDTLALRDVAKLYAKYDDLYQRNIAQPVEPMRRVRRDESLADADRGLVQAIGRMHASVDQMLADAQRERARSVMPTGDPIPKAGGLES